MTGPGEARELELSKRQCFELLSGQQVGRLAFVDDNGPIVLPVNFFLDNHLVIIRTDEGTKLSLARHGGRVAFEVDAIEAVTGLALSVLIRGEAIEVTDQLEVDRLSRLPLRPWAPGRKSHIVRILPAMITGRRFPVPDMARNQGDGP
jgi:nitroimidazol reductase NimA-like FMN-containing flavoprotein (pyridoxamine 5'-phosphate oxidase superfamily)